MGNDVFANGREVSCKKADGKSICAFPDVCFTPPENPATPPGVPVPYPNTGMAKDMTSGSKSVKISGNEVMLKNKSYFKKSIGNEAGCAAKKGIVTSVNRGKVYFISWSMDVKFEGENVVRHLDMTTHNHASPITNTCPWPYSDTISAFGDPPECTKETQRVRKACKNSRLVYDLKTNKQGVWETHYRGVNCTRRCKKAMKCILVPKKDDKKKCCRPTTTGHHLIEDNWVKFNPNFPWYKSNREKDGFKQSIAKKNLSPGDRTVEDAPCICADNIHKKKAIIPAVTMCREPEQNHIFQVDQGHLLISLMVKVKRRLWKPINWFSKVAENSA